MRKFKLWNATETTSYDLSTTSVMVSDVSGLGLSFAHEKKQTSGRTYMVDSFQEFDEIALQVYFGINGNPYTEYKAFADFIISNGSNNFVLEYRYESVVRLADVRVKRLPKTQKDTSNTMNYQLILERLTPWYEKVSTTYNSSTNITITNVHLLPLQLKFTMYGGSGSNVFIYLKNTAGTITYRTISIPIGSIPVSITLVIDSELKKVLSTMAGSTSNGYGLISRANDTFMMVEQGSFRLDIPVLPSGNTVLSYKKWVID